MLEQHQFNQSGGRGEGTTQTHSIAKRSNCPSITDSGDRMWATMSKAGMLNRRPARDCGYSQGAAELNVEGLSLPDRLP